MKPQFKGKIFLLENYNIAMSRLLVSGVDVWLNTPRRPMEASGTSGQKASVNGVINFSVLDGWWAEGYNSYNGWTIGTNKEYDNYEEQDISLDGGNIVTQTSEMGTYILCVERNYATDGSNLEEGTYSVDVAVWNMIQNQPSMADQGVKSPAKLVVENDKKILYLEC